MSTTQVPPRPDFGRLYGITYDPATKEAMVRVQRVLKVGIGIPKGRAIQVFKLNGDWLIRHGVWEKQSGGKDRLVMKTVFRGKVKAEAEAFHNANKEKAAISNRPQKQPFFGFTRRTVVEVDGKPITEVFEPDFDAIEAHGDCPRRIPVILTSESPLMQEDQWWSATELKCHGDGLMAERVLSLGSSKDEWWDYAKKENLKMFPYAPCRLGGCPHAGSDCKQHSTLELQLSYARRLGVTAYFSSTGQVTASQLFSSLASIRLPIERLGYSIVGVPMDLVLGSFRANHDGKPSVQPCVSLELTAAGAKALNALLAENSWVPARIGEVPKMLSSGAEEMTYDAPVEVEVVAAGIAAEFSDTTEPEFEDGEETVAAAEPAAAATQVKQEAIGEKLKAARSSASTLPWKNQADMVNVMRVQQFRVGNDTTAEVIRKHGCALNDLKFDDPMAVAVYAELKALPDESGDVF